eukprot:jgi/Tetstr1/464066/TSEL_008871.t1
MRKITPDVWGGPMWRTIHVVALGYPRNPSPEIRRQYKAFYDSLRTVIPCITCREGYNRIVDDVPVDDALANSQDLFNWTVHVHNRVNEKLGKLPMTPDFVRSTYVFGDGDGDGGSGSGGGGGGSGGDGGGGGGGDGGGGGGGGGGAVDPAIDRALWKVLGIYGMAFLIIAIIAWLVYLLFRRDPTR